jgi:hypothetical protein
MTLRKAKEQVPDYYFSVCSTEKLGMIRRVEELHLDAAASPTLVWIGENARNALLRAIERCHADICEIAGIEREE